MTDFNHEFLEIADIIPAFTPIDLHTAANNGQWIAMKNISRLVCVLFKGSGTLGDDPIVTIQQATNNSGNAAKPLPFTRVRTKIGAISTTPQWTVSTQTASGTFTTVSAASQAMIAVEIRDMDLDRNNGFDYVQLSIPATGANPQLGAAFYIAYGLKYLQSVTPSAIS